MMDLENGWITYKRSFLHQTEADQLFHDLLVNTPWNQGVITMFGKKIPIPRQEAFYSEKGLNYGYSGQRLISNNFSPELAALKRQIEESTGQTFNCVLVNLYRNGQDSNGWHADNEKELGRNPVIASVSLGVTRRFDLKHNLTKETIQLELEHGSLLIMGGELQHYWKHQIPKQAKIASPRINLTFRKIV